MTGNASNGSATSERARGESVTNEIAKGEDSSSPQSQMDDGIAVARRPTRVSGAAAMLAAAAGVLLVGGPGAPAVGVVLVGLTAMAAGDELRAGGRGGRAKSLLAFGAGGAIALAGVATGAVLAGDLPSVLRALPGLFGVLALGVGVVPLGGRGSRRLVKSGAGLVLIAVLVTGVFRAAPPGTLVGGAVAAVLGWDLGENAVNVGEQLGRAASTWRTEVVHALGGALVGVAATLTATVVDGVGSTGLSLPALALLVLAVVLLSVGLHE